MRKYKIILPENEDADLVATINFILRGIALATRALGHPQDKFFYEFRPFTFTTSNPCLASTIRTELSNYNCNTVVDEEPERTFMTTKEWAKEWKKNNS